MPHLPYRAFLQKHFHNIETQLHLRILQQMQIIQRRARESSSSFFIHSRGWAHPFFGRARFDFHKHKAIAVAKNQIHLPALGAKIRSKKFQALLLEMLFGRPFTQNTILQMNR